MRDATKTNSDALACLTFLKNMIGKDLTNTLSSLDVNAIQIQVSDFDSKNHASKQQRLLRYVQVTLPLGEGRGSVVLGDTWCVGATHSFNVTECIPYLRSWVCTRLEGDTLVDLKRQVARSSMESLLGKKKLIFFFSVANIFSNPFYFLSLFFVSCTFVYYLLFFFCLSFFPLSLFPVLTNSTKVTCITTAN